MKPTDIFSLIQKNTKADVKLLEDGPETSVFVPADAVFSVMEYLKSANDLAFNNLMSQTAVHEKEELKLFWHLFSFSQKHRLTVESVVPISHPKVASVTKLWAAADWLERETYDLFGVEFVGHPDLRRIMLPEDWEGFPLRKDYVDPNGYRDIDNSLSEIDKSFKPKGKKK